MAADRILIVDDEPEMIENCRRVLASTGYQCFSTTDSREALRMLERDRPDLLLTDLRMPEMDGMEILRQARETDPHLPVIMLTGHATVETAVAAVKAGAFDYLSKPFSIDQLQLTVARALTKRRLEQENLNLREQLQGTYGFENILGRSLVLQQVLELVRKAARSDANVLILGESGTGKELIARAIHANSPRCSGPFVPVDCASLPETLLESELFGHEKGAFTGAATTKRGLIETAHGGTLFLDELGEFPMSLQAKLLRTLQERQIRHVGGTRQIDLDVRVVSATNRDLRLQLANGQFREDLYYRVNVIDVAVPPLRERSGDVELLATTFLRKFRGGRGGFEPEAMMALVSYQWPGNVRELQNVVERACALAEGERITLAELPSRLWSSPAPTLAHPPETETSTGLTLKEAKGRWIGQLEAAYVSELLKRESGNVSEAARKAGVDRKTIHRLLNKHGLR
ncbi:MAG: sigma-54-dependent Fis family transcriptional regulator [Deltaproteobacteria bacterium]|nr:sigma-54-dependent Fis family transcriptional regulator [Deltaproteobacteria bacterium]